MSADEILELTPPPRRRQNQQLPRRSFLEFCHDIGVDLFDGQREVARVAFDGEQPTPGQIWGDVAEFPEWAYDVFVAVCGARGGKTYVFAALRLLHLACTVPLPMLAPGEFASGLIVAPDLRLARQCYRFVLGAMPRLEQYRIKPKSSPRAESVDLQRPDGSVVTVECLPATRGGGAVRGRSYVGAVLDECAFFRDSNYAVNDEEIYRAVEPRIVSGGQLVLCSTAYAKRGLLYQLWKENYGKPQTCIVAHAPTLVLHDDEHTRRYVARETKRDPENARREFGAEFMDTVGTAFFSPTAIENAVDDTIELGAIVAAPHSLGIGADFGFRNNASALAIASNQLDVITLNSLTELLPGDEPLKPSEVVATFARSVVRFRGEFVVADGHYRESIAEHLLTAQLSFVDAPSSVSAVYQLTRTLLREGKLRIPRHAKLLKQLEEVQYRPLAGGGVSIINPIWKDGSHGDLVSAFVLAVWDAHRKHVHLPKVEPEPGTQEWEDREDAKLQAHIRRMQQRKRGMRR